MKEFIISEAQTEKAALVGLFTPSKMSKRLRNIWTNWLSWPIRQGWMRCQVLPRKWITRNSVTFVGTGKLQEIKEYVVENEIGLRIFDDELSPKQLRNIEKELQVKILDRTSLILISSLSVRRPPMRRHRWSLHNINICYPA